MDLVDAIQNLFLGTGATWILWLLLAFALACLGIGIERARYLRGRGGDLGAMARTLEDRLTAGDVTGARAALESSRTLAATVARAGLRVAHLGPTGVEKAMQGACAIERDRLESHLAFLGTLG